MVRQLVNGVVLAALAFGPLSAPSHAQTTEEVARKWRVAVWAKAGYQRPSGEFARNLPSDLPELVNFVSQFRVDPAMLWGGGVEVRFPSTSITASLGWEVSGVANAVGTLGICNVLGGPICEPTLAPTRFQSLMADVRFLMRRRSDRIRPFFLAGTGLRQMSIDAPSCDQTGDALLICQFAVALYEDPSPHGYLRLGLGLEVAAGPLLLDVGGSVGLGQYAGGDDRTTSNWYNEIRIETSAGLVVY